MYMNLKSICVLLSCAMYAACQAASAGTTGLFAGPEPASALVVMPADEQPEPATHMAPSGTRESDSTHCFHGQGGCCNRSYACLAHAVKDLCPQTGREVESFGKGCVLGACLTASCYILGLVG